jgi:hypothetical protein
MTKAAAHHPVHILSPDGTGIRSTTGCACGEGPKRGAANRNAMYTWYRAHARKVGVAPDEGAITYAIGRGYAAEGMTWDEWYAANPGVDPYSGTPR